MLVVKCVPVGRLFSNAYIVFDQGSLEGIIIDAGDEAEKFRRARNRARHNKSNFCSLPGKCPAQTITGNTKPTADVGWELPAEH